MIMGWHRAALAFLRKHQGMLQHIPLAVFVMCMSLTKTGETSVDGVPVFVDEQLPKPPEAAGRLRFKERYARLTNYLRPALIIALPMLVLISGAAFALGAWTRKAILVFVLPIVLVLAGFFFLWSWSPSWLDLRINRLLMLIDPGGVRWLSETYLKVDRGADYYNTQRIGFDAAFLLSRLALLVVGVGAVAAAGVRFAQTLRQSGKVKAAKRARLESIAPDVLEAPSAALTLAQLGMQSSPAGFWHTVWQVARSETRELKSQPGLYLFVPLILFQIIGNSLVALGAFDTPLLLTSGTLAVTQMGFMTTLLLPLVSAVRPESAVGTLALLSAAPFAVVLPLALVMVSTAEKGGVRSMVKVMWS